MGKPDLWQRVRESAVKDNESVLTQVFGIKQASFAFAFLLGAFRTLLNKSYVLTLTEKHIYFTPLNTFTNSPEPGDSFAHSEIIEFIHQKGFLSHTLFFRFTNGNALKLTAYMRKDKEGLLSEEKLALLKQYLAS